MTGWPPDKKDGEGGTFTPPGEAVDSSTVNLTPRELMDLVARAVGDYPSAKRANELRRQAEAQCERMRRGMLAAERRAEKMVHLLQVDTGQASEPDQDEGVRELVEALEETVEALAETESGWDSYQIKKLLRRWQDRIRQEGRPT